MVSKVFSCICSDTEAHLISVEADIRNGLPGFFLCGASNEVKESKERVRVAVENAGFFLHPKRITVNITPAGIKTKSGSLDLPIAVAVLAAYGLMPDDNEDIVFAGELSLEGNLKAVDNAPLIAIHARNNGFKRIILPIESASEASIINGIDVYGADSLETVLKILDGDENIFPFRADKDAIDKINYLGESIPDFCEINCDENIKRYIEASVAGHMNIMFIGGDRVKACNIMQCMKKLDTGVSDEQKIYYLEIGKKVNLYDSFELTNNGFMLLMNTDSKSMKEYMNNRELITNCIGTVSYSALCPCGLYPDTTKCLCSKQKIEAHIRKINSSILKDTDVFIYLNESKFDINKATFRKSTSDMNESIKKAVAYKDNAERECGMNSDCVAYIKEIFESYTYSETLYNSIIKAARAIADIDESKYISAEHIREAFDLCIFMKKGDCYD